MDKEISMFSVLKLKKAIFAAIKFNPFLKDVDIEKVLISKNLFW